MAVNKRSVNSISLIWLVVAGFVFLAAAGFIWYSRIYLQPENVFWGTIENNLATSGVTRQVSRESDEQTSTQYTRLQAGQKASELLEVVKQKNGNSVKRQTVGTVGADFARYAEISSNRKDASGQPLDYSKIEGVWGKAEAKDGGQPPSQYLNQAVLSTIPAANLAFEQRQELMKVLRGTGVFKVDFEKVTKLEENGQDLYVYDVEINAAAYFSMMRLFVDILGLDDSIVPNPEDYKNAQPLPLRISIKPSARQLEKIIYLSSGQEETYSAYGQTSTIAIPKDTIPLTELQKRIQEAR